MVDVDFCCAGVVAIVDLVDVAWFLISAGFVVAVVVSVVVVVVVVVFVAVVGPSFFLDVENSFLDFFLAATSGVIPAVSWSADLNELLLIISHR